MELYLAGNFVIMGKKEKEKAFQERLEHNCFRLAAFYYKKEIDIVVELKGDELNGKIESEEKIGEKSVPDSKRISNSTTIRRRAKIIRKKKHS